MPSETLQAEAGKVLEWGKLLEYLASYAQSTIGVEYCRTMELEEDLAQAFDWYEKAALNGSGRVQYDLASMYQHGKYVPASRQKAIYWFEKARAAGLSRAQTNIDEILAGSGGV